MVKGLRHRLFTAVTRVRIPYGLWYVAVETLDAAQIKSIYETGKMPEDSLGDSEEDNHALSYDEVKERIENKNKDEEE